MNKWQTTLRVEEIRREITDIQAANRIYKAHITHTVAQNAEHEKRQRRLQEIMVELGVLSRPSSR
jgi:hypothetical protein